MAKNTSAGILLYRRKDGQVQVFLAHPGGPFWNRKDLGAWSIPKGIVGEGEDAFGAAKREFEEEIGQPIDGEFVALKPVRQKGGKTVVAWAVEGDADSGNVSSNVFTMEWPPKSGKRMEFAEVDRAEWFSLTEARSKLNEGQVPLLDQLEELLGRGGL